MFGLWRPSADRQRYPGLIRHLRADAVKGQRGDERNTDGGKLRAHLREIVPLCELVIGQAVDSASQPLEPIMLHEARDRSSVKSCLVQIARPDDTALTYKTNDSLCLSGLLQNVIDYTVISGVLEHPPY